MRGIHMEYTEGLRTSSVPWMGTTVDQRRSRSDRYGPADQWQPRCADRGFDWVDCEYGVCLGHWGQNPGVKILFNSPLRPPGSSMIGHTINRSWPYSQGIPCARGRRWYSQGHPRHFPGGDATSQVDCVSRGGHRSFRHRYANKLTGLWLVLRSWANLDTPEAR